MRVFLGVKLPDHIRSELAARLDALPREPRLRWVDPGRWHLTLQFLGPWSQERCNALSKNLLWSRQTPPFEVRLGAVGQFPARGPLRVLYLHVDGDQRLSALAARVRSAVDAAWPDGPQDRKPFHPHLTLARGARKAVPVVLPAFGVQVSLPPWPVDGFGLFSSNRESGRLVYREETFFPLRK